MQGMSGKIQVQVVMEQRHVGLQGLMRIGSEGCRWSFSLYFQAMENDLLFLYFWKHEQIVVFVFLYFWKHKQRKLCLHRCRFTATGGHLVLTRFFSGRKMFSWTTLHEKVLQKQNGDGPLVSSHERRALFVPQINQ